MKSTVPPIVPPKPLPAEHPQGSDPPENEKFLGEKVALPNGALTIVCHRSVMTHGLEWLPNHLVFESGNISCKQKGSSTKVCLAFCMGSCEFRQAGGYHIKKILPQTI